MVRGDLDLAGDELVGIAEIGGVDQLLGVDQLFGPLVSDAAGGCTDALAVEFLRLVLPALLAAVSFHGAATDPELVGHGLVVTLLGRKRGVVEKRLLPVDCGAAAVAAWAAFSGHGASPRSAGGLRRSRPGRARRRGSGGRCAGRRSASNRSQRTGRRRTRHACLSWPASARSTQPA